MRTVKRIVSKHYEEDELNGWAVNYEFETDNGVISGKIQATATKDGKALAAVKSNPVEKSISVSGEYDNDVAGLLVSGIAEIITEHTPAPAAPAEG